MKAAAPAKKRGMKVGTTRPGSAQHRLTAMAVGDVHWIETTLGNWDHDMRVALVPRTRRKGVPEGAEFTTRLYTAVGTAAGDIRYLIRLERTQ